MQPTSKLDNSNVAISELTVDHSQLFIGKWNGLISTTNWEKGRIICAWRESLAESVAEPTEYSDEAWSQMVGGVTAQHVGRLRRTFARFGHVFAEYDRIYWSHFYAALDWDDAEMWLEGAVQSGWSVSKMRQQRWETLGQLPDQKPTASDIVDTELHEEAQSLELSEGKRNNDRDYIEGPVYEGPDFGDEDGNRLLNDRSSAATAESFEDATESVAPAVRLFESFTDLPEDVEEATNSFKIAIIRHKNTDWAEISKAEMVSVLDALKKLAE